MPDILRSDEKVVLDYCPEQLTGQLIQKLKTVLATGQFDKGAMLKQEGDPGHQLNLQGQLEFFFEKIIDPARVKTVRQASDTWNSLPVIYRLTVLDAYSALFYESLLHFNAVERTVIFCQIFIHDLVDVLTSH